MSCRLPISKKGDLSWFLIAMLVCVYTRWDASAECYFLITAATGVHVLNDDCKWKVLCSGSKKTNSEPMFIVIITCKLKKQHIYYWCKYNSAFKINTQGSKAVKVVTLLFIGRLKLRFLCDNNNFEWCTVMCWHTLKFLNYTVGTTLAPPQSPHTIFMRGQHSTKKAIPWYFNPFSFPCRQILRICHAPWRLVLVFLNFLPLFSTMWGGTATINTAAIKYIPNSYKYLVMKSGFN